MCGANDFVQVRNEEKKACHTFITNMHSKWDFYNYLKMNF